eukprot:CAMPEP_0177323826 /NCGR_PEP_ID=MMETSP0368-20130122/16951_1 /TAXON_ID=447022 ORGANISM="Scrippsiella hangoei-like, Strain SHHI-4" /NCGR_SAMPLE_ID=MMETSP0368 /ASSEMBLY_ACC=CAM_ASM_000363 /LENGTH=718 /DNA_ID=CAMNT_0018783621 /DNA_START=74 /DNA_END=2230 /DNA_ORIENTATION=+
MKIALALGSLLGLGQVAHSAKLIKTTDKLDFSGKNPIPMVVELMTELKERVIADGKLEEQSYDKYACWCEDTMGRKAKDIANEQEQITDLGALIVKFKSEIAAHGSEIEQLKKDIADNAESRREATEVRDKEFQDYHNDKLESENCGGALEAAVKVLSGAGAKKGFLETTREAQLLSVVAGVRAVLTRPQASNGISQKDLDAVKRFVERPEDFMGGRLAGFSAAQVANNPFGDYAPQSTQIQGILKGMYDTFTGDLEKANAEEADSQKAFEELMATKQKELETLQATLEQQKADDASKLKKLAESEELQDNTKTQLEADEKFFAETKDGCKVKATEWNDRSRLRTMELQGVSKAVEILTNEDAQKIFQASTSTFVQLSAITHRASSQRRNSVYQKLAGLARRYHNFSMTQLAAHLRDSGHFDKVIGSIDGMIEILRKEEQSDIEHRDRCQNADGKNKNDMEDLDHSIEKTTKNIERLASEIERLYDEIEVLDAAIAKTKKEMDEALELRNKDVLDFKQALKDDAAAIDLVEQAKVAITKFYKQNGIPLALVAKSHEEPDEDEPEYTVDKDKAPETSWSGADYGGRKSETVGVISMMDMIKEDLEKEMKTGRADDAEAQQMYESLRATMQESLDAALGSKVTTEKELAETKSEKAAAEESLAQKNADQAAEKDLKDAIYSDCSWVATHFDSRRTKRRAELEGLAEAKSYLAGIAAGEDV